MTGSSENHLTFSRQSDPSCFLLIRILTVVNTNDILNYKMSVCMYTYVYVCVSDEEKTENLLTTNYFSTKQNMLLALFWHRHSSNNNRASVE